jgi:hypothetical protein
MIPCVCVVVVKAPVVYGRLGMGAEVARENVLAEEELETGRGEEHEHVDAAVRVEDEAGVDARTVE